MHEKAWPREKVCSRKDESTYLFRSYGSVINSCLSQKSAVITCEGEDIPCKVISIAKQANAHKRAANPGKQDFL